MKIGLDIRMYGDQFTGIGRYNVELTKRLFALRPDIEWVVFLNDPQYSEIKLPSHVRKVLVNVPHYSLAEQTKFLRILNKEKCDLVHFTHFNLPLFYRGKFVVTIHDTTISFFPGKKMNSWFRKLGYQLVIRNAIGRAHRIITVSENTKKDVMRLFGTSAEKITPIHIGVGNDFTCASKNDQENIRKKYGLDGPFLLYTGNWREHKNLTGLLSAFQKLVVGRHHPDLKLVITGKPDPCYPEVLKKVEEIEKEGEKGVGSKEIAERESKKVVLTGLIDFQELVDLFSAADVFVFPTFYEGFGLPPLESMACGTPVAASRVASVPEVCGEGASYFDPYDIDDMARVMGELLDDEKKREALIEKGLQRVKQFSWDNCAEETLLNYQRAMNNVVADH